MKGIFLIPGIFLLFLFFLFLVLQDLFHQLALTIAMQVRPQFIDTVLRIIRPVPVIVEVIQTGLKAL